MKIINMRVMATLTEDSSCFGFQPHIFAALVHLQLIF